MDELSPELLEDEGGIVSIWLLEAGNDKPAKEELKAHLCNQDIAFRNLKRILRTLFNDKVRETYKDEEESKFNLGYRKALQDVFKLIPKTKSN